MRKHIQHRIGFPYPKKEPYCWVCVELKKVSWARIEFPHIIKELGVGDFNYCPRCGRKI